MLVGVPLTVDQPLLTGIHPELEVAVRVATAAADVKVRLALTICPPSKPPRTAGTGWLARANHRKIERFISVPRSSKVDMARGGDTV